MTRKKQVEAIQKKAQDLWDELDYLIVELEEAFENVPENLQDGERGQQMQERIETLTEWRDNLSEIWEADLWAGQ